MCSFPERSVESGQRENEAMGRKRSGMSLRSGHFKRHPHTNEKSRVHVNLSRTIISCNIQAYAKPNSIGFYSLTRSIYTFIKHLQYDNMRAVPQGTESPVQGRRSQNASAETTQRTKDHVCSGHMEEHLRA